MEQPEERGIPARTIFGGRAEGEALVTQHPLAFWGGIDPATGIVIDVHHELCGRCVAGKVLAFPWGVGSSSGCGVLMEMVRCGTNPAAMINVETEAVLALGPIIAQELYGRSFPIVTIPRAEFERLATGDRLHMDTEQGVVFRIAR